MPKDDSNSAHLNSQFGPFIRLYKKTPTFANRDEIIATFDLNAAYILSIWLNCCFLSFSSFFFVLPFMMNKDEYIPFRGRPIQT